AWKSENRDEPSRSRLQSEADDRHPRGAPAHPGDEGRLSFSPCEKPDPPESLTFPGACIGSRKSPSSHGLCRLPPVRVDELKGQQNTLRASGVPAKPLAHRLLNIAFFARPRWIGPSQRGGFEFAVAQRTSANVN